MSRTVSRHSWIFSVISTAAALFFLPSLYCTLREKATIIRLSGNTQTTAKAIFQLTKNNAAANMQVLMIEPINCGMKCDEACSICAASSINAEVRSALSFLAKNDRGSLLNFSAKVIRLTPLSLYVEKNDVLYCTIAVAAIITTQMQMPET